MSVSQDTFKALVEAAAANRGKIVKVAVTGFGFVLTLAARRSRYDVSAHYDPATDQWSGVDPYGGGTLSSIIGEISREMKK